MVKKWLPPIELCCDKCNKIVIQIQSNLTLHFFRDCPEHGRKGISSILSKSKLFGYEIEISDSIKREFKKEENHQLFI